MKFRYYLLCFCFTFSLLGQSYDDKYVPTVPGLKLVQDASIITYKGRGSNDKNRGYSNSIKASIENSLLSAARQETRSHLAMQRIKRLNKERAFNKEAVIASHWVNSQTGKLSGMSWWALSEEEKLHHRISFAQYWNKPSEKSPEDELEEEMALAWAQSKTGQADGRTWREIPQSEKISLKYNYMERKKRGLVANKKSVPQVEYKLAWASLKSKGIVNQHWWELSPEQRNYFRKAFHEISTSKPGILLAGKKPAQRGTTLLAKR
jgi:hypothetical protein